jgi:outer membrane protein TolC
MFKAQMVVNVQGIKESWLPKLNLNLQGTYQSEVVQFNLPGFKTNFPHDSYLGSMAVEQLLFDGGTSRRQTHLEAMNSEIEIQKNKVEIYRLVDRVNQIYMAILLAKANISMLELLQDNLMKRSVNVAVGVSNGMVLQTQLDEIEVELLKTQQQLIEAKENLNGLCASLSILTGKSIAATTELQASPAGGKTLSASIARPESTLLLMQESALSEKYKLSTNLALPKLYFNVVGNYGRPGPNFINQDLRFFGSGNIALRWNISNLYGLSRERKKFDINRKVLEIQRDQLNQNIESSLTTHAAQLAAMDQVIQLDEKIIQKKSEIASVSANQLDNGKITSTVYLLQLNDEMAARLNLKVHEIKRLNAWSNYNITLGLINF